MSENTTQSEIHEFVKAKDSAGLRMIVSRMTPYDRDGTVGNFPIGVEEHHRGQLELWTD